MFSPLLPLPKPRDIPKLKHQGVTHRQGHAIAHVPRVKDAALYRAANPLPLLRFWQSCADWRLEDDKLPAFLRTLITRPDLALCVESLQLQGSGIQDLCGPELMQLLADAGRALNFKLPVGWRWEGWVKDFSTDDWSDDEWQWSRDPTPFLSNDNVNPHRLAFHDWLMGLAIALTPRTKMLMYMCESPELHSFQESKTVLPALKTLALRGAMDNDYFLVDIHPLINAASNLETLYALDSDGAKCDEWSFSSIHKVDRWENLAVSRLHKLVLDDLYPEAFNELIRRCAQIEDLEYYIRHWSDHPDIIQAIYPRKERLRRLCFGYLPPPVPSSYESRLPDGDYVTISSLQQFAQLEELVIDQALLYRKSMYEDLLCLALEAPAAFPSLYSIKIGLFSPIPPERAAEMEHMKTVESAFASRGVRVTWAEDFMGPFLYTAIPGGAPGVMVLHVPASSWA
ncbi:hypothetical protein V501_09313 [Pseudogymnoascus sp. VKM F-4519 (FW-2642)]|nr:hypothetical protein V501_09313 [Pseudogymnoascus sp. VKM F-4519 (FW-2642)]